MTQQTYFNSEGILNIYCYVAMAPKPSSLKEYLLFHGFCESEPVSSLVGWFWLISNQVDHIYSFSQAVGQAVSVVSTENLTSVKYALDVLQMTHYHTY